MLDYVLGLPGESVGRRSIILDETCMSGSSIMLEDRYRYLYKISPQALREIIVNYSGFPDDSFEMRVNVPMNISLDQFPNSAPRLSQRSL